MLENRTSLDFFIQFIPCDYIKDTLIPATNAYAQNQTCDWQDITFEEFIHVLGILYSMEVYRLPERRMYWSVEDVVLYKALNYGRFIGLTRIEKILHFLQFSHNEDKDEQILELICAVNAQFKEGLTAGDVLVIDESMVKSFHRNLKGKMKIIRKPCPIGNEYKTLCDGRSYVVLHIELYEGKEYMKDKEHVTEYGATTATTLRLTDYWKNTGRIVVGDSWFGSVKTAVQLMHKGLYSNLLVKTAHKNYP